MPTRPTPFKMMASDTSSTFSIGEDTALILTESTGAARAKMAADEDTTGGKIWDSGRILAETLMGPEYRQHLPTMNVVELGSGTGIGGLTAASAGASVTLTDGSLGVLPLLEANVRVNGLESKAAVQRLRWGYTHDASSINGDVDLVIGSDLLYSADVFPDLLDTLEDLCVPDHTEVLVSPNAKRLLLLHAR